MPSVMAADDSNDTAMVDAASFLASSIDAATAAATAAATGKTKKQRAKEAKARELFSTTYKQPPFAYAHIEAAVRGSTEEALDALQIRTYCDAALKQFLGATGAGMPLDLLKIDGSAFWLRLPREDLSCFAAALAAWSPGAGAGAGPPVVLRLKASGNWLGSLVGRSEQQALWSDT